MRRFAVFPLLFLCGYGLFWYRGIRVGLHPYVWRQSGAIHALDHVLTLCKGRPDEMKLILCVKSELVLLVRRWGLHEVMIALEKRQTTVDPSDHSRVRCHDLSHQLGAAAITAGQSIQSVLTSCTNLCQSGCFHGASGAWIGQGKSFFAEFPTYCFDEDLSQDSEYSCVHGLGHAIVDVGGYDVSRSLAFCDTLPIRDRPHCGAGVFMETYETISPYTRKGPMPVPKNHPGWCADISVPYDEVCFARAGIATYIQTTSLEKAVSVCRREPTEHMRSCLVDTGKHLYFSYPPDPERVAAAKEYCKTFVNQSYEYCIEEIFYNSLQ